MLKRRYGAIRVVVDDSPVARELLVNLLQQAPGMQVVCVGVDGVQPARCRPSTPFYRLPK